MSAQEILNFKWHIPGKLATGGKPSRVEQVHWLADQGIGAIVSIESIPDVVVDEIRKVGLNYLLLPAHDYEDIANNPEAWSRFRRFVYSNIVNGKPIFVHCSAGITRSVRLVRKMKSDPCLSP